MSCKHNWEMGSPAVFRSPCPFCRQESIERELAEARKIKLDTRLNEAGKESFEDALFTSALTPEQIRDHVVRMVGELRSSITRSEARCKRLEDAMAEIRVQPIALGCRSECRASRQMADLARAALATDSATPVQRLEAATDAVLREANVKLGRDDK